MREEEEWEMGRGGGEQAKGMLAKCCPCTYHVPGLQLLASGLG